MSSIVIGKYGTRNVQLDVDVLLRTRMLVQANSGKGKSWLLRRIAEQLFGKIQVLLIDPEGEFATLRENFGYVLVGKGGETPADPRSASLVAHKLLELKASAVCDLYEMKPFARHEWVQRFIDGLIDAPKNLWHPCVVIVDEAHTFCPEKGAGESIAAEAVIGLATRGRKRGFALVAATQRLGKFRKDAAAELLNILVGGTFIDIDRKRAADALGVYGSDQRAFFDQIKLLDRGSFYALGPAISDERILVKVGDVETTHPEAGSARHAAEPPPAPEKIRALLPKLADLPKSAEEKAKNEAELRKEIRELKAQLRTHGPVDLNKSARKIPNLMIDVHPDPKFIERATRAVRAEADKVIVSIHADRQRLYQQGSKLAAALTQLAEAAARQFSKAPDRPAPCVTMPKVSGGEIQTKGRPPSTNNLAKEKGDGNHLRPDVSPELNGDLTPYQRQILNALAELEAVGIESPRWPLIGAAAGKSSGSSTFERYAAKLKSSGLVTYPQTGRMQLTAEGRGIAKTGLAPLSSTELQERTLKLLTPYQADLVRALIEAYPEGLPIDELAARAGKTHESSTFERYLAALRSMEIVESPRPKTAKAADWMFIE